MITNDTRIIDLTVGELRRLLKEITERQDPSTPKDKITTRKIGLGELCQTYGFSKSTVYNWTSDRFIPHSKVGKRLIFDVIEINQWILSLKIKTKKELKNI
ncbi:MAG TPA: helix-turn-helix domain-containing protein [Bacteroidia bacterium]|nr:helix-turn-helix domain-containing protein [Bacteroidia bacterium]